MIYNQIVTWTVFAILAMFLSWHGKYPRDIYFRRAELFWYWIKLERDRRYSSSNKGLRGTPVIRHNHHNPLLRKKNLDKCKFSKWNTKNCFSHSFVTSRAKLIVVHPNMHPNMHTWHIWPYLAYLGAPNLVRVSLKRSCKMQFRRVGLRSIGPSSQKLQPNLIFGLFPHCNYNVKLQSGGPNR